MKITYCTLLLVASAIFQVMAVPLPGPNPDQATIDLAKRVYGLAKRDGNRLAYVTSDGTTLFIFDPAVEECLFLSDGTMNISNDTDLDVELFEDGNCDPQFRIDVVPHESTITLDTSAKTAKVLERY